MLVKRVWIEVEDPDDMIEGPEGSADVMVEMENGELWTAHFVTLPYLKQQMSLSLAVAQGHRSLGSLGFVALETPHVIVDHLDREAIEDIVDNLLALGTFEAVFDLVTDMGDLL
jgi:hypothetical protein